MRELHGWHGEHARHARDAHAPADNPATRPHDGARHAAQDALKLRMLRDPEARKAARLAYQQKVEAAEAGYAARHAKPSVEARAPDQRRPQEPKPEHTPPEARDRPASRIAERWDPAEIQKGKQPKPHRSRLPKADTVQMLTNNGVAVAVTAVALGLLPDSWEKVTAGIAAAIVSNVAWGNRRWKDKHGNRPED